MGNTLTEIEAYAQDVATFFVSHVEHLSGSQHDVPRAAGEFPIAALASANEYASGWVDKQAGESLTHERLTLPKTTAAPC
jgi:hypothetical protein